MQIICKTYILDPRLETLISGEITHLTDKIPSYVENQVAEFMLAYPSLKGNASLKHCHIAFSARGYSNRRLRLLSRCSWNDYIAPETRLVILSELHLTKI